MSTAKVVRLRLPEDEYDRLIKEAKRRGVSPDALASVYVHEALFNTGGENQVRLSGIQALEELRALRQRIPADPSIDAVELVRSGREELNIRTGAHGTL